MIITCFVSSSRTRHGKSTAALLFLLLLVTAELHYLYFGNSWGLSFVSSMIRTNRTGNSEDANTKPETTVAMIIASQKSDNMTWLKTAFPKWKKYIYVTDSPEASLTVAANKGRENMVYLR